MSRHLRNYSCGSIATCPFAPPTAFHRCDHWGSQYFFFGLCSSPWCRYAPLQSARSRLLGYGVWIDWWRSSRYSRSGRLAQICTGTHSSNVWPFRTYRSFDLPPCFPHTELPDGTIVSCTLNSTAPHATNGQFYTRPLMIRDFAAAIPHAGGLLFQQYILDAYCRSEAMRMNWFPHKTKPNSVAKPLTNYIQAFASSTADVDDMPEQRCGTPIILPS